MQDYQLTKNQCLKFCYFIYCKVISRLKHLTMQKDGNNTLTEEDCRMVGVKGQTADILPVTL